MATVEDARRTQLRNIEAQYGRSMSAWSALIRANGLTKHGDIITWLKSEHGMTHGNANVVALLARGAGQDEGADPATVDARITEMFAGPKAAQRTIYDRVIEVLEGFGGEVEVAPKRGYVSLRRRKQFAMLQPAAARADLGLILPGLPAVGRLELVGSSNAMFTHRVRLSSVEEVDRDVEGWLRTAYDAAG